MCASPRTEIPSHDYRVSRSISDTTHSLLDHEKGEGEFVKLNEVQDKRENEGREEAKSAAAAATFILHSKVTKIRSVNLNK
jgi:hypothetical protein